MSKVRCSKMRSARIFCLTLKHYVTPNRSLLTWLKKIVYASSGAFTNWPPAGWKFLPSETLPSQPASPTIPTLSFGTSEDGFINFGIAILDHHRAESAVGYYRAYLSRSTQTTWTIS